MPNSTTRLGLPKPLGNETFNRTKFNELIDAIDSKVAARTDIGEMTSDPTPNTGVKRDANGRAKIANPSASDDIDNKGARDSAINAAISALLNGAPGALDTLKELADAMGADPNFAATVTNALALKAPLASPSFTGNPTVPTQMPGTNSTIAASTAYVDAGIAAHVADYVRQPGYGTTAGAANTYTLALTPALAAYTAGAAVAVKINVANTGASTININGLGAKSILDSKGNVMTSGKLRLNGVYTLRYDGTAFILQGEGGSGNAVAANLLAGKTASVDSGDITGTMQQQTGDGNGFINRSSVAVSSAGRITASLPDGFYSGMTAYLDDPDFIAANFPAGVNIFGLVGTGANAKRVASGQGVTNGSNNLVVSGLAFVPSKIMAIRTTRDVMAIYNKDLNATTSYGAATSQLMTSYSITTPTSGTFTINCLTNSVTMDWIAIE